MVNEAEVSLKLPSASVTRKTTSKPVAVSVDVCVHVKLPTAVQLSVACAPPLSSNHAVSCAALEPLHSYSSSEASSVNTGATLSSTVMVTFWVALLLHWSVAVKTTTLSPRSLQSNDVLASDKVTVPQLSEVPLSSDAAVMLPFPSASN